MLEVARRNPQFARLWMAQIVSQAGDWLNRVACLVLIGRLGGGSAQTGFGALFGAELVLRLLPAAFLGPLAGPIADRLPRRLLMVSADITRAITVLAFLFVRERGDLYLLYALIMLQMGIGIFFEAARSAALPSTVDRAELHSAQALSAATWSVMLSLGALAGGWVVEWFGVNGAFVVDAASYVGSALFLAGMRLPPVPKHEHPLRWSDVLFLKDLRRGAAHVRELGIGPVLWAKTFWGGAGGFLVLLSLAGRARFGEGAGASPVAGGSALEHAAEGTALATGLLYAARGLGTGLGPILARFFFGSSDVALRRQIGVGFAIAAAGYAAFGCVERLDAACACVAFAHLGGSVLWVASTVFLQKHVADAYRGRAFAVEFLSMNLAFAAGGALCGWLYDWSGSFTTTVWINSALVLALGATWSWLARGARGPEVDVPSTPTAVTPE
jgi:predicted MFS family arabinose efflux permease